MCGGAVRRGEDENVEQENSNSGIELIQQQTPSVPSFILKVWKLVSEKNGIVFWSEHGRSFQIRDVFRFSRELLPLYFKHSNVNSFIRQLNMYGFRKVSSLEPRTRTSLAGDQPDIMEFQHPCFVHDHPELLVDIRRNKSNSNNHKYTHSGSRRSQLCEQSGGVDKESFEMTVRELEELKAQKSTMASELTEMKKNNDNLAQELCEVKAQQAQQSRVVNKLLTFVLSMTTSQKRGPHMLNAGENGHYLEAAVDSVLALPSPTCGHSNEGLQQPTTSSVARHKDTHSSAFHLTGLTTESQPGPIINEVVGDEKESLMSESPAQDYVEANNDGSCGVNYMSPVPEIFEPPSVRVISPPVSAPLSIADVSPRPPSAVVPGTDSTTVLKKLMEDPDWMKSEENRQEESGGEGEVNSAERDLDIINEFLNEHKDEFENSPEPTKMIDLPNDQSMWQQSRQENPVELQKKRVLCGPSKSVPLLSQQQGPIVPQVVYPAGFDCETRRSSDPKFTASAAHPTFLGGPDRELLERQDSMERKRKHSKDQMALISMKKRLGAVA